MDWLTPVALWLILGALTEVINQSNTEVEGYDPWWLTVLSILSWPLLLAVQVLPIAVTIAIMENDDEG